MLQPLAAPSRPLATSIPTRCWLLVAASP